MFRNARPVCHAVAAVAIAFMSQAHAAPVAKSGEPLRVGGDTVGPITRGSGTEVFGAAVTAAGTAPDLFLIGVDETDGKRRLLRLSRRGDDSRGGPVFAEPRVIGWPKGVGPNTPGAIVRGEGSAIRAVWLVSGRLIRARLDLQTNAFVAEPETPAIEGLPRDPETLAAIPRADGGVDVFFAVGDGVEPRPGDLKDWRHPTWHGFNGAGIWRGPIPTTTIYAAEVPANAKRAAATRVGGERDILWGANTMTDLRLGRDGRADVVVGSRTGTLTYYRRSEASGVTLDPRRLLAGVDGVALRHPNIHAGPRAYPSTEADDLLVGGEGNVWFYRSARRAAESGAPVFELPVQAVEPNATLYAGSLPVTTAADWDGDGQQDLLVGNSAGMLVYFRNVGSPGRPEFARGVYVEADGRPIQHQPGYWDIQGPGEARWGYLSPTVVDWNNDGLPDVLASDASARHVVYLNVGTRTEPKLDRARPLYSDGLDVHGTWRVKPGVARMGDRMAYVALDDDDEFRLYRRIDDQNLEDAGKLGLEDGRPIRANFLAAGGTGRAKISLVDWDRDGKTDLIVGTPRHGSIPDPDRGLPKSKGLKGAAVIFLRNVGTDESPKFVQPTMMKFRGEPIYLGQHECGPTAIDVGNPAGPDLIVGREYGALMFYSRQDLTWDAD